MNHQDIENDDVVERYLLGHLSPDEAERFEAHYLGCQECLDRLELGTAWIAGAKAAAADAGVAAFGLATPENPETPKPETKPAAEPEPPPPLPFRRRWPQKARNVLALAALLALALGAPLFLRDPDPGPVVAVIDLERGEMGPPATIIAAPAGGFLVLALQLTPPLAKTYTVELYRRGQSLALFTAEALEPDGERLVIVLPADRVESGDYELRLRDRAGNELGAYRFATFPGPSGRP